MVRINSPFSLNTTNHHSFLDNLFGRSQTSVRAVVLHIHGGGFICQNSFVHQMYTRLWAKNLNLPVVSVDYRLSPEYTYPAALDDCFQAYLWTVNYFTKVFANCNGRPLKIIITGDSAGGNLAAAVTALAIKFRLKVPDAAVLCYPALDLSTNSYTPSRLASLDDFLLPMSVLKLCQEAYVPPSEFDAKRDPFISPILLGSDILKKFPRTRLFVGTADALLDDSYRFTEKLMYIRCDTEWPTET